MFPMPIISNTSIAPLPFFLNGEVSSDGLSQAQPRKFFGYCSGGGEFYFLCGTTQSLSGYDVLTFQKYNPQTNTIQTLEPIVPQGETGTYTRIGYTIQYKSGKIYAYRNSNTMSVYDTATNTWTYETIIGRSVATGYACHSAIVGDIMYIQGGYTGTTAYSNVLYAYNTNTNEWNQLATSPSSQTSAVNNLYCDMVYDGLGSLYLSSSSGLYKYNISSNSWSTLWVGFQLGRMCWNNSQLYMFRTPSVAGTVYFSRFDFIQNIWVPVGSYTTSGLFGGALLSETPSSEEIYYCLGWPAAGTVATTGTIYKIT